MTLWDAATVATVVAGALAPVSVATALIDRRREAGDRDAPRSAIASRLPPVLALAWALVALPLALVRDPVALATGLAVALWPAATLLFAVVDRRATGTTGRTPLGVLVALAGLVAGAIALASAGLALLLVRSLAGVGVEQTDALVARLSVAVGASLVGAVAYRCSGPTRDDRGTRAR
jgi:hypothetical protein